MASSFDKYQKRKLISSYISVVISIALVLFLLGCLGLLVINSKKVADHFKEQVVMTIYLNDTAKEVEVNQLKKSLAMADYSKEATYVSKEEAAEMMKAETGEDFMDFVGYNPLKNSIDVYLKADFVTTEKLSEISGSLSTRENFLDFANFEKFLEFFYSVYDTYLYFFKSIYSIVKLLISLMFKQISFDSKLNYFKSKPFNTLGC